VTGGRLASAGPATGRPKVREVKRAQLLLAANAGAADAKIARAVSIG